MRVGLFHHFTAHFYLCWLLTKFIAYIQNFQEFLDTVVLFSRGKTEDKLRIIFDMCDNDRNGVIDKGELSEMLRSLVEIARTTSLSDAHVTELIDGMFQVRSRRIISDKKLFRRQGA